MEIVLKDSCLRRNLVPVSMFLTANANPDYLFIDFVLMKFAASIPSKIATKDLIRISRVV